MRHIAVLIAVMGWVGTTHAQLPTARLGSIFPPGGQVGTPIEVVVTGADLEGVAGLYFSDPGIIAKPKIDPATGNAVPNTFIVRASRDLSPGAYDVRAVGRFGVSNPRVFVLDRQPQAVAKPGNTTPETAAELPMNSGLYSGTLPSASQYFKLNLKAGGRVFVETEAAVLDSRAEMVVSLFAPDGRQLATSQTGEPLDFTPPADGAYLVEVHDVVYRGGGETIYRLRVTDGPHVDYLLPPAVRPAEDWPQISVFGRNRKGTPTPATGPTQPSTPLFERLTLAAMSGRSDGLRSAGFVPSAAAMLDGFAGYELGGSISPHFIGVSRDPLIMEAAGNDEPAGAQKLTLPAEVYGQFLPRGDRDWFSFEAKKGEALWIEVVSNRTTGITDPMVLVQRVMRDASGKESAVDVKEAYDPENIPASPREFPIAHRDPAFRFAAPEDGTYRVMVRDLFNETSDDPRRVYRMSIAPAAGREDFRLVAWVPAPQPVSPELQTTQIWGANLRPGGALPVRVVAIRSGGFAGDITLSAENLPAGVSCQPVTLNGPATVATLILAAEDTSPAFVGPIRVVGTAAGVEDGFPRTARSGAVVFGVGDIETQAPRSRVVQELAIAVTSYEPEPISIRSAEQKVWEQSVAGKIEVPLKIARRNGFTGVINLKPGGAMPQVLAMPAFDLPAGAAEGKFLVDIGALALPVGDYSIYLQGTSVASYNRFPEPFAAAQAAKAAADKATPELAAAVDKANQALQAAKAKADAPAVAAAEKEVAAGMNKIKQNEVAKAAVVETLKTVSPRDTTAFAYSPPIQLKITPAPITFAIAPSPPTPVKPGGKIDLAITIARLYGFTDAVDLTVTFPAGVMGLAAPAIAIPAGATGANVAIAVGADAKPGTVSLTISAAMKQNDRAIKIDRPFTVTISAP